MEDDEIWESAKKPVEDLVEAIKEMESNAIKMIEFYSEHSQNSDPQAKDKLSPLTHAKLELSIVFAMNASYWVYLITHGEDPSNRKIAKDLNRIRLFMDRAKEVEESIRIRDSGKVSSQL